MRKAYKFKLKMKFSEFFFPKYAGFELNGIYMKI